MITAVICLGSNNIRIFCDFIVLSHNFKFVLVSVESGSDDPDYLGHSAHFLVGQVGLMCELIYLDVTQILNRSHVL